jgi:putative transposase
VLLCKVRTVSRGEHKLTEATIAFLEYLRNIGKEQDADFLREGIRVLTQALMELEVSQQIGAQRYQRRHERSSYRNGYRERVWQTRVGDIGLPIPKVRDGSYFPSFLEPRRRPEQAPLAVVQPAYIEGVSTRKVDDLVQSLGLSGMDQSAVSRICKQLDEVVEAFRNRPPIHFARLVLKHTNNTRRPLSASCDAFSIAISVLPVPAPPTIAARFW